MVILKSYFIRGSSMEIACQRLSNIELSAVRVNSSQCKVNATKRSILDITRLPDPPLITIFGKVTFNFTQQLSSCSSSTVIATYGRSYEYGNDEI